MRQVINTNKLYLLEWFKSISEVDFLVEVYKHLGGAIRGYEYDNDTQQTTLHFNSMICNVTNVKIYKGEALLIEEIPPGKVYKTTVFKVTVTSSFENYKEVEM